MSISSPSRTCSSKGRLHSASNCSWTTRPLRRFSATVFVVHACGDDFMVLCSICHCMFAFAIRLSTCRLARNCSNDRSRRSVGPQGRGTMRSWILKGSMWEGLHVHASAPQHIVHCRHHGSARFPFLAWLFSFCLMCGEVPSGLALG